ncbi:hypothetical protein DSCO28_72870 (plasmid) [Desulfosarcina ovata subsp. sediminis]|uniref:DUF72 domain-containing protein n=1 Tax=Desulfosarcina ovata subsp. sediminis TaxID=885957 RepID=A0A5K8A2P8_9BACT|nr:DUF72 domain-containing protein [Desulfosarcina ovata]BBO86721.1 hypothetical protein DSCO28_72870 [Desulfosarcina ovata subsp. sediminis]
METKHERPAGIMVGTSGYAYSEWVDAGFYPPGTGNVRMLPYYAGIFPVTEINYTWYQMPKAGAMDRMCRKVPEGFYFSVKLTRTLTHEVDPKAWPAQAALYRQGIAPLVQSRQLLAVLVQLPPFFRRNPENRRYLARLLDALDGLPLAVEFRHVSWAMDRVFASLEERRVSLVCVDVPDLPDLFPPMAVVTNPDLFYIRFHGRNAKGWRSGSMQHQFDYDYSDEELAQWLRDRIPKMSERANTGIVFFNNHVRGQAPKNARMLMEQLK